MISSNIKDMKLADVYQVLTGAVSPRPIALVATRGGSGINLAPFSFFNLVSIDPAMLMFSPLRKFRDASLKDTFHNVQENPECTVQVVSNDIVEKVNVCSKDFSSDINEFKESGLTMIDSDIISVPRVKESPVQMECRVDRVISLGEKSGAGSIVLCEILRVHIEEAIIKDERIDPESINLVARNNLDIYTRASGEALFDLKRPT